MAFWAYITLLTVVVLSIVLMTIVILDKDKTLIKDQQYFEKRYALIADGQYKVFLPAVALTKPPVFAGAEYEGGGLTTWAAYNNPNTNNKISIYVPDIIDYAYDYNIDWTIPDRKINNHDIY